VTVGVVSQPAADADYYRCRFNYTAHMCWLGNVTDVTVVVLVILERLQQYNTILY